MSMLHDCLAHDFSLYSLVQALTAVEGSLDNPLQFLLSF